MNRALALAIVIAVAGAGCQTMTARSAAQWADDRAVTARVKARLAADDPRSLTRIHVDTWEGIVYLTGGVPGPGLKERATGLARQVEGVRQVVDNLHVADGAVAASPPTDRPRDPFRARYPGVARLEMESGTPGWTRYAAYDSGGRRVATVYAVTDGSPPSVADLRADGFPIDHVALVGAAPRYVVLWHVSDAEAARLR